MEAVEKFGASVKEKILVNVSWEIMKNKNFSSRIFYCNYPKVWPVRLYQSHVKHPEDAEGMANCKP